MDDPRAVPSGQGQQTVSSLAPRALIQLGEGAYTVSEVCRILQPSMTPRKVHYWLNTGVLSDPIVDGRRGEPTLLTFQQLLETLTQTMSDLVQLLPQSTWGSIFDVLSQDLKDLKREYSLHRSTTFDGLVQDDLPDEVSVDDDVYEVDPPTPTMDKRARWMEVQLAKLEELHRDVNKAAINAILAKNDYGWDPSGFLPHIGNTRTRFDQLGHVNENGTMRPMTIEELEKKLVVAKEAVVFAETELRESMQALQALRPTSPRTRMRAAMTVAPAGTHRAMTSRWLLRMHQSPGGVGVAEVSAGLMGLWFGGGESGDDAGHSVPLLVVCGTRGRSGG